MDLDGESLLVRDWNTLVGALLACYENSGLEGTAVLVIEMVDGAYNLRLSLLTRISGNRACVRFSPCALARR